MLAIVLGMAVIVTGFLVAPQVRQERIAGAAVTEVHEQQAEPEIVPEEKPINDSAVPKEEDIT